MFPLGLERIWVCISIICGGDNFPLGASSQEFAWRLLKRFVVLNNVPFTGLSPKRCSMVNPPPKNHLLLYSHDLCLEILFRDKQERREWNSNISYAFTEVSPKQLAAASPFLGCSMFLGAQCHRKSFSLLSTQ